MSIDGWEAHKQELEVTTKKLRGQLDAFSQEFGEFDGSRRAQELYKAFSS